MQHEEREKERAAARKKGRAKEGEMDKNIKRGKREKEIYRGREKRKEKTREKKKGRGGGRLTDGNNVKKKNVSKGDRKNERERTEVKIHVKAKDFLMNIKNRQTKGQRQRKREGEMKK